MANGPDHEPDGPWSRGDVALLIVALALCCITVYGAVTHLPNILRTFP